MSRLLQNDAEAIMWGVRHAQGIVWCDSEQSAREVMKEMARSDSRRQAQARGKVRLLCRYIGVIEEVENPYPTPSVQESQEYRHDCASCLTCGVHDGRHDKCCGCYDGVCCQSTDQECIEQLMEGQSK